MSLFAFAKIFRKERLKLALRKAGENFAAF